MSRQEKYHQRHRKADTSKYPSGEEALLEQGYSESEDRADRQIGVGLLQTAVQQTLSDDWQGETDEFRKMYAE